MQSNEELELNLLKEGPVAKWRINLKTPPAPLQTTTTKKEISGKYILTASRRWIPANHLKY